MSNPVALFAYDFPHRKTHDFILDLLAYGISGLVVLAAPKKALSAFDSTRYFSTTTRPAPPLATEVLCRNLKIPYYRVEHGDTNGIRELRDEHNCRLAIVSGARIIKSEVIKLFAGGVVNFHPGKIPETSGLDAFYYTIRNMAPAGVTTHFIDGRVDAGHFIGFHEVEVALADSCETLVENLYQVQRIALRGFVDIMSADRIASEPIHRPRKNHPMTPDEKRETLGHFDAWKAHRYQMQNQRKLFRACEIDDAAKAQAILRQCPNLADAPSKNGWTPLIVSAFNQSDDMVLLLLEKGANPNATGLKGTTVLMYAKTKLLGSRIADYAIIDRLVGAGADVNRKDALDKSLLDYVVEAGDHRLASYLVSRGAK